MCHTSKDNLQNSFKNDTVIIMLYKFKCSGAKYSLAWWQECIDIIGQWHRVKTQHSLSHVSAVNWLTVCHYPDLFFSSFWLLTTARAWVLVGLFNCYNFLVFQLKINIRNQVVLPSVFGQVTSQIESLQVL